VAHTLRARCSLHCDAPFVRGYNITAKDPQTKLCAVPRVSPYLHGQYASDGGRILTKEVREVCTQALVRTQGLFRASIPASETFVDNTSEGKTLVPENFVTSPKPKDICKDSPLLVPRGRPVHRVLSLTRKGCESSSLSSPATKNFYVWTPHQYSIDQREKWSTNGEHCD
jgi:hypothetical protein